MFLSSTERRSSSEEDDDCLLGSLGSLPSLFGIGTSTRRRSSPRVYHVEGNVAVGKTECAQLVAESIRAKGARVAVVEENVESWFANPDDDDDDDDDDETNVHARILLDHLERRESVGSAVADGFDVVLVERHPTTTLRVFDPPRRVAALFEVVGRAVPDFLEPPERTVYVKNSARSCRERATRRNRERERCLDERAFDVWDERLETMMRERENAGKEVFVFDTFGADSSQVVPAIVRCLGYDR